MRLLFRMLWHHVSAVQTAGFVAANAIGLTIVAVAAAIYADVKPLITAQGAFAPGQVVVAKPVGPGGAGQGFTPAEVEDLAAQPWATAVGQFTASQFAVYGRMGVGGVPAMGTEMFFEAVPDEFVDAPPSLWAWSPDSAAVPIILPRSYLALYNLGFASTRQMPRLSEGMASMVSIELSMSGPAGQLTAPGRIVGFTSRLNTILAPATFIAHANAALAPGQSALPLRLVATVPNTADPALAQWLESRGYTLDGAGEEQARAAYLLRVAAGGVAAAGALVCALALMILTLSIHLVVQKSETRLRDLMVIGYTPRRVALPYHCLVAAANVAGMAAAMLLCAGARAYYIMALRQVFPAAGGPMPALPLLVCAGVCAASVAAGSLCAALHTRRLWNS